MKKQLMTSVAVLAVTSGAALAGGIERSSQSIGILFEKGNHAELTFSTVSPNVTGVGTAAVGGGASGNMAKSYSQIGFSYKHQFNDNLSAAVILDTPYGVDVAYPTNTAPYFNRGASADLNSRSITALLKYTTASNMSFYGGVRYQTMDATASVPAIAGYGISTTKDSGTGFVVGVAYEKPEIALRVALTYNSRISHTVQSTETSGFGAIVDPTRALSFETPESINLEFQSGVAANTLVFGSIRWVDWANFSIDPVRYRASTGSAIVDFDNSVITYNIGVGRKINDNWSAALSLGYEKSNGGFSANLGPTDGNFSFGVGGSYTQGNMKITAGVRYVDIGDAVTKVGVATPAANFTGNYAIAAGVKVGFTF
jgi:long-subunit fatty acid transport protein